MGKSRRTLVSVASAALDSYRDSDHAKPGFISYLGMQVDHMQDTQTSMRESRAEQYQRILLYIIFMLNL